MLAGGGGMGERRCAPSWPRFKVSGGGGEGSGMLTGQGWGGTLARGSEEVALVQRRHRGSWGSKPEYGFGV